MVRKIFLKCVSTVHLHYFVDCSAVLYIGRSDVTVSMATTQSPFCRYNMAYCVELRGEDLPCYLNKIQSTGL